MFDSLTIRGCNRLTLSRRLFGGYRWTTDKCKGLIVSLENVSVHALILIRPCALPHVSGWMDRWMLGVLEQSVTTYTDSERGNIGQYFSNLHFG